MQLFIPGSIAIVCYLLATALQVQLVLGKRAATPWIKINATIAVFCHGATNYIDFTNSVGFDLGIYSMLSLMTLSIVAIVILSSLRRPVDNLFIVIFPFASFTLAIQCLLHGDYVPRGDITAGIIGHIVLSVVAYSLLTIAAAQALLLSFGDRQMKNHAVMILRNLPPLETMEQLMFEMLWAGLLFLTLSIVTGFFFVADIHAPGLIHHTVITFAAWIVFSILMWGRFQLGWRGAIASRWAVSGFVILAFGYFGSKLVLEIILAR